jgi:putative FmdB family regulatory protein
VPTYSYACTECGNRFDAVQAFTDDALTTCPKCSGRLRKLFNSVGVVFKGSGFYRTDSRAATNGSLTGEKSSDKNGEKAEKAKPEKSDKSDSGKSDGGSSSGSSTPAAAAASS